MTVMTLTSFLNKAWEFRKARTEEFGSYEALRVFHGPGEGPAQYRSFSVDRFKNHFWITEWMGRGPVLSNSDWKVISDFYREKGADSIVRLKRPEKDSQPAAEVYWGNCPTRKFEVQEGVCRFWIQLQSEDKPIRQPGLFLDHAPLRRWLLKNVRNLSVLNTFSYTGSLSVASELAGAKQVTTLDLSRPALDWAELNSKLNQEASAKANPNRLESRFICGDIFDWFQRLVKRRELFDCVILDPPSFSRAGKNSFSTAKDLQRLHELAIDVLNPGGILITSINSANLSWEKYQKDVSLAAAKKKRGFKVIRKIDLPETFPTALGDEEARYLKGLILKESL